MKHPIRPMLCGWLDSPVGNQPFVNKPGTAYELKWDGYRMIAVKEGGTVSLYFRSGNYATAEFPEIVRSIMMIPGDVVLDGEVMVLRNGSPSFQDLQNRMGLSKARRDTDLRYMVYDVLQIGQLDCTGYPYSARRQALEKIHENLSAAFPGSSLSIGVSSTDGAALWSVVMERKLEGLIAKPLSSTYRQNERGTWVKIKRHVIEKLYVAGYTEGIGKRTGYLGAMIVAEQTADGLRLCGCVGTGFTDPMLADLRQRFAPLEVSPAEGLAMWPAANVKSIVGRSVVQWVKPEVAGLVEYPDRTDEGVLRMAAWKGVAE